MTPWYKEYSDFLSEHFQGKIQKLSVDAAFTCPNRDGSIGRGGCIYCNNLSFSPMAEKRSLSVAEQIEAGRRFFARKYPEMRYLAYFQSYTSTYGKIDHLMDLYRQAISQPGVEGLVIGTRPDCMPDELLRHLGSLPGKVFVEFGAESSHDSTLKLINRGHSWAQVADAVERTSSAGFPVGLHLILGLPGEDRAMMLESVARSSALPIATIKFHQLQILRGTPLAVLLDRGAIPEPSVFTPKSYAELCADVVDRLPKSIAVDRFVASAPPELVIAPKWGLKNYQFTALLHRVLAERDEARGSH